MIDKPAVITAGGGRVLTFGELDRQAAALAAELRPSAGEICATLLWDDDPRWVVAAEAAARAGLARLPLDPRRSVEELRFLVRASAAPVVVCSDGLSSLAGEVHEGARVLPVELAEAGPAIPHDGVRPAAGPLGIDVSSRLLVPASAHRRPDVLHLVRAAIEAGATAVLLERFQVEAALVAIERHRVTHAHWTTSELSALGRAPSALRDRYDTTSIEVAVHGPRPAGPAVKGELTAWWGPVLHGYYWIPGVRAATYIGPSAWPSRPWSIGRTVLGRSMILDQSGDEVGPGTLGEVHLGDGVGASRTAGDLGYLDDEGFVHLVSAQVPSPVATGLVGSLIQADHEPG